MYVIIMLSPSTSKYTILIVPPPISNTEKSSYATAWPDQNLSHPIRKNYLLVTLVTTFINLKSLLFPTSRIHIYFILKFQVSLNYLIAVLYRKD